MASPCKTWNPRNSHSELEISRNSQYVFIGIWNSAGDYVSVRLDSKESSEVANYIRSLSDEAYEESIQELIPASVPREDV